MKPDIRLGYYKHFKGEIYQVFGVVQDSETLLWQVLYGKTCPEWVRPIHRFNSDALVDNQFVPRFEFLRSVSYVFED